jgi:hypothetical protein
MRGVAAMEQPALNDSGAEIEQEGQRSGQANWSARKGRSGSGQYDRPAYYLSITTPWLDHTTHLSPLSPSADVD